jgi:hypothetical protein
MFQHGYVEKGKWVKYFAHLGCWISPCYGPFLLGAHFEAYEPFISLIFQFFPRMQITQTGDAESADMGARLYSYGGMTVFIWGHDCIHMGAWLYSYGGMTVFIRGDDSIQKGRRLYSSGGTTVFIWGTTVFIWGHDCIHMGARLNSYGGTTVFIYHSLKIISFTQLKQNALTADWYLNCINLQHTICCIFWLKWTILREICV